MGKDLGLGECNSACCVHIYSYTGAREVINIDKVQPSKTSDSSAGWEREAKIKNRHVIHIMANSAIKKNEDADIEYHKGCLSFFLTGKSSSAPNTIHPVNSCSSFWS